MYRKGEVTYQALPLPDRVQMDAAGALAGAPRRSAIKCASGIRCGPMPTGRFRRP